MLSIDCTEINNVVVFRYQRKMILTPIRHLFESQVSSFFKYYVHCSLFYDLP